MATVYTAFGARAPTRAVKATALIFELRGIVGDKYTLISPSQTRRYRTGFRFGCGNALAVVRPGTLVEQWKVLQACIAANVAVICQASNTGITGGSTPDGDDYDRDIVIVSPTRINKAYVIVEGRQVVCLPGVTLDQLEKTLQPFGREPHSVIGSSCIGASVFGGVCNNSGGALVQRGPAYTEMALFAQVDESGALKLVNHLGIELGDKPDVMLARLEQGVFTERDIRQDAGAGSDHYYASHVREVDANTPARYNADPQRLHEASGSAGKLMLFGVRMDTFPVEQDAKVFYIGTNEPDDLTELRRSVLQKLSPLPISAEYLHRDAFDVAEKYGKDTFLAIRHLGTSRMPALFALKSRLDELFGRIGFLPSNFTDRVLQSVGMLFPSHLPPRLKDFRNRYEHHLMLKVAGENVDEARALISSHFETSFGEYFECTDDEGSKAFLHRFVTAGAAVRYRTLHGREVEDIVALDIALRRNDRNWPETLPSEIDEKILIKLYYGHFLCHVFHQDYIVKKGNDCTELEHKMWSLLDHRGAEYPAEHNVGHLYKAKPQLVAFYKKIDPCNCFNPGIGQTSKFERYRETVV